MIVRSNFRRRRRNVVGPVVSQAELDAYFGRKLDRHDWIKKLDRRKLLDGLPKGCFFTKPRLHQLACFNIGIERKQFLFFLDMGAGKAQPVSEPVLTPTGWKSIGSIKQGTHVIGADGQWTSVLSVHPQGIKDIFKVTFSDGGSTRCCEDHLWSVTSPTMKWLGKKPRVIRLKDLPALRDAYSERMVGPGRGSTGNRKVFIPVVKPVTFRSKGFLLLDPYLLGAYLGDGDSRPAITTADEQMLYEIQAVLPDGVKLVQWGKYSYGITAGKKTRTKNPVTKALKSYGLWKRDSYSKFIPQIYLFAPVADRESLLQGLIDTDGYVSPRGGIDYSTSSKRLCNDVVFLVRSLGGIASVTHFVARSSGRDHWRITIRVPTTVIPCRLERKLRRWKDSRPSRYEPTRAIVSVEREGREDCVCISVAAHDGLYVTNDFVVTHNTKLTLDLFRYHKRFSDLRGALVLVPNEISIQTWIDEVKIHAPDLTFSVLLGTRKRRREALSREVDLYFCTYPALQTFCSSMQRKPRSRKMQRVIDPKLLQRFAKRFGGFALDESHKIGHHTSLVSRIVQAISKHVEIRYGLTGTPFGRDPTNLFPQFKAIDHGATLGQNLTAFHTAFFKSSENYWGGLDWTFRPRYSLRLHRMMQHRSIRYSDEEFSDVPASTTQVLRIPLPVEAQEQYAALVRSVKAARGNVSEYKNAFTRMRMAASGFLAVKTELGERLQVRFKVNPKLDALRELACSLPDDCKMLIFHEFILSGDMLCEALTDMKFKYARLGGKKHGLDQMTELNKFLHDPKVRFMVGQNEVAHASINPQYVCSYGVFYETPTSPIKRRQAVKRFTRQGQTKHVHFYDLCAVPSIEQRLLEYLDEGRDLFEGIVQGRRSAIAALTA